MFEGLFALSAFGLAQLVAQILCSLVRPIPRLAFLLDFHQRAALSGGGSLLRGLDVAASPGQVGAEGLLLTLLQGARLLQLKLKLL